MQEEKSFVTWFNFFELYIKYKRATAMVSTVLTTRPPAAARGRPCRRRWGRLAAHAARRGRLQPRRAAGGWTRAPRGWRTARAPGGETKLVQLRRKCRLSLILINSMLLLVRSQIFTTLHPVHSRTSLRLKSYKCSITTLATLLTRIQREGCRLLCVVFTHSMKNREIIALFGRNCPYILWRRNIF